jgi:phage/plasmid-associated DNA primase
MEVYLPEFKPTCKLWLYGNHKPVITDTTASIWRRIRFIKCNNTVLDGDRIDGYAEKFLFPELEGILAWAVAGCLKWQKEGLGTASAIKTATDSYRQESDILGDFIQDCCIIEPGTTVTKAELKEKYHSWCQDNGIEPVSQKTFKSRLSEKGIFDSKSGSTRYWRGIELTGTEGTKGTKQQVFPINSPTREIVKGGLCDNPAQNVPAKLNWDKTCPDVLPNCPDCGLNQWTFSPDGQTIKCPCGYQIEKGGNYND